MKILVIGSSGFIGRNIMAALSQSHEVYGASRQASNLKNEYHIDLLVPQTIKKILLDVKPEIIINCAGIVDNSEAAMQNPIFTTNLIKSIIASNLKLKNILISGSASEYGLVAKKNIPVNENTPLSADSGYGLSKLREEQVALSLCKKYKLPIVVVRIFNPIGVSMHSRFLIPRIIQQVNEAQAGKIKAIEVSRLDSKRDYVNVKDVALAIKTIVDNDPKELVYNIGSGKSTSNKTLINLIVKSMNVTKNIRIIESSAKKESLIAIQADISRLKNEFNWNPKYSIKKTVEDIVNAVK